MSNRNYVIIGLITGIFLLLACIDIKFVGLYNITFLINVLLINWIEKIIGKIFNHIYDNKAFSSMKSSSNEKFGLLQLIRDTLIIYGRWIYYCINVCICVGYFWINLLKICFCKIFIHGA